MIYRREVIKSCASVGILVKPNSSLFSANTLKSTGLNSPDLLDEGEMSKVTKKAVDAAMALGAAYADVRVIRSVNQAFRVDRDYLTIVQAADSENYAIGVRVLINGCFGFASSPFVDIEEAAILSKVAFEQAKENSTIRARDIEWTAMPAQQGRWVSPGRDPFVIPIEERVDFITAWREEVKGYRDGKNKVELNPSEMFMKREEKFFANSDGTDISQVLYNAQGNLSLSALGKDKSAVSGPHTSRVRGINPQQGGWEVFENAKAREQIPELVNNSIYLSKFGVIPVEVGRYDLILDGGSATKLLGETFGKSTQLDLAVGYEANAGGTSYLGPDPLDFLGNRVAADGINIRCDRSGPGKISTVKWDDEGVIPASFDIVKDGILFDYQTTRDSVHLIKKWYHKNRTNINSNGCASSQDGFHSPIQVTPNLELQSYKSKNTIDDMISSVKTGFFIMDGDIRTSFNIGEGFGSGTVREIRNGKLGEFVNNFQLMFNTAELWKSVASIGDNGTVQRGYYSMNKGQPMQRSQCSIDSPALAFKAVPVIDSTRKA